MNTLQLYKWVSSLSLFHKDSKLPYVQVKQDFVFARFPGYSLMDTLCIFGQPVRWILEKELLID